MKIMKLLAACAMVGALATTTAMAAPVQKTFLGEYDATNNSIAINLANEEVAAYADTAAGDLTVLVTSVDVEGQITNSNIFQIDQGTLASLENDTDADTNVKLAVLKLSAAVKTDYDAVMDDDDKTVPVNSTYYVRLGGGTVADTTDPTKQVAGYIYDTFTFEAEEEPAGPSRAKGDIVGTVAGEINLDDIVAVKQISVNYGTWEADQLVAADVVGTTEGEVNLDDVVAIMQKSVGMDVTFKN